MAKLKNLSTVENEIFSFIRSSFSMNTKALNLAFTALYEKLKKLEGSATESRSFMYLDVLSWLESKIKAVPVQVVIAKHYEERMRHLS
jgi:hypothetical protein